MGNGIETECLLLSAKNCTLPTQQQKTLKASRFSLSINYPLFLPFSFYTSCFIVLKKSKNDNSTLFIDASKESEHSGNKEKLAENNIQNILNAFVERKDKPHFAALVRNSVISENDYNIAVSSYVEQKDTREVIDIKVLNAQIAETVKRQDALRKAIDDIVNGLEVDNNG